MVIPASAYTRPVQPEVHSNDGAAFAMRTMIPHLVPLFTDEIQHIEVRNHAASLTSRVSGHTNIRLDPP